MFINLFKARLSRYIVTWVFISIVVVEMVILIPSYLRRQNELLSKLEIVSEEVFAGLIYKSQSEVDANKFLRMTSQTLKPGTLILGAVLYKSDGKLVGDFGEKPDISPDQLGGDKVTRVLTRGRTRYDIAWVVPIQGDKYFLIVRHNSFFIKQELVAYSARVAGLIVVISVFVTLTTMLTLGVTVIRPILRLRDDLVAAGEAISEDKSDPLFSSLSVKHDDEMGEVILAFNQMFRRVRQEISNRRQMESCLLDEQQKSERLLLNILPSEIAQQLKQEQSAIASEIGRSAIANRFDEVTILFADIVNFTGIAAQISPIELVNSLNQIFSSFDRLAESYGLEKIKTIGDAYMVVGGLPIPHPDHAVVVAKMALDMQKAISQFHTNTGETLQLRIGINTGSVVAGVIGLKKFSYDLWGDAVNIASRMESHGVIGKIQVTEATYLRIKEQYKLEKRGIIQVKGIGEISTYFLIGKE